MQRRIPRQLRHFDIENTVDVTLNEALQQNMVEISTLDHPGLLARVGGLFMMQSAAQFLITDTVILGIIVIAIVAVSFELFLRWLQKQFSPWYGQQL
ncbi:hypothetical protein A7A34_15365 [Acinetobacter baumannii]|uniref:hypothetical protein n=1 Tax=Acinetobacter baumannii TaxID=470 RepID=UPI000B625106